ncbi:MAG: right-handed parallel beta-helix repeat-containing protein [Bacillota bacterium]
MDNNSVKKAFFKSKAVQAISITLIVALGLWGSFLAGRESAMKSNDTDENIQISDADTPLGAFVTSSGGRVVGKAFVVDSKAGLVSNSVKSATANTKLINEAFVKAAKSGIKIVRIVGDFYVESSGWANRYSSPLTQQNKNPRSSSAFGIIVPSGFTLDLTDATLRMKPNGSPCYVLINVANADGVTILNGTLIGDSSQHDFSSGGTHEHGHGVMINNSKNVTVTGMKISGMTGDGINLISYVGEKDIENVQINNNRISNCRRQGISIASGVKTIVTNNTITNIGGTAPEYGIDVELQEGFKCDGTVISNNTINNCRGGSVLAYNGNNYKIIDNNCGNGNIIAYLCQNVVIKNNQMLYTYVSVSEYAVNVDASIPDPTKAVLSVS